MNLKRLFLLSVLILLCDRGAAGQPTCSSMFSAFSTCSYYYFQSEHVFVGRVISLDKIPNPTEGMAGYWWKALVAVETSLKGDLGGVVELTLDGRCFNHLVENQRSIFTANSVNDNAFTRLHSSHWSNRIDDIRPDVLAKILDGIRSVLQGVPQPRLVGRVAEHEWSTRGMFGEPGKPLPGIVVLAEGEDGKQYETRTDADGHFQFDKLEIGTYAVHPIIPKKMDVYAGGSLLEEGGKQQVQVGDGLCSAGLNFDGQQTGNVTVRIEREKGEWKGPPATYLYRVRPDEIYFYSSIRPSSMHVKETGPGNVTDFAFERVPVGPYVLSYEIDTKGDPKRVTPSLFYPLAIAAENAKVIDVAVDKPTEIVIKLPFLQERRIFGQTVMLDGTPVSATVQLIDAVEPAARSIVETYPDGRFELRIWEGRPFSIYAYHIGKKGGKLVRFFAQTENMVLNSDLGPMIITLDQIER